MAELMTVRGYAKSRGMAHTSVAYQIKMKRIPLIGGTTVGDKVKGGKIDAEYADHVFAEKVDQRQSLRGRGQQRKHGAASSVAAGPEQAAAEALPDDMDALEKIRSRVPTDYNEAAYLDSVEKLIRARALNAEAEGKLTATDKVTRAQFELARQVRDSMLAIPSRIQDLLAAETSADACGRMLAAEIRQALETAAKQARALTEDLDEALAESGAADD